MEDIRDFFKETENAFTIYVVEQRFAVGRGADYFRSFRGKENYIDTNERIKNRVFSILQGINKKIPDSAALIKSCFNIISPMGVLDVIAALSKLFTIQEHQAAGPDVIDPIIIQEGAIMPKYVNQVVALHKFSFLRPTIIILLKDNDFDRGKKVLSGCPHNTNIKMIRNSGQTELYKVVNSGAENVEDFLDAFSCQCFNTCSYTRRDLLYNEDWAGNSIIKLYSPTIMQMRTNFLYRDKTLVRNDLSHLIDELNQKMVLSETDNQFLQTFRCILRLYRVFCNDGGGQDVKEAYEIAKNLNHPILMAHVYRYAYFMDNYSFDEKLQLLDLAYDIFVDNGMEDNAIYCKNNRLVRGFDTEHIYINDFVTLQEEAVHNVPGLVGMPHIYNNVGVAHLMTGHPDESIFYFNKGLDYAYRPERCIQKLALLCNRIIADFYSMHQVKENELFHTMNMIFDNKELMNIPFISARYAMNIFSVALMKNKDLGKELLSHYPIAVLVQRAFNDNILGRGQLMLQLNILEEKDSCVRSLFPNSAPSIYIPTTGIKKNFLIKTGFNPFVFSTWF